MTNLDLGYIAGRLEGLEETIIQKLIDRVQFLRNSVVYEPGKSGFRDEPDSSLFELRLRHQEEMDSLFGRFLMPEERPFNRGLPEARRRFVPSDDALRIDDCDLVNLSPVVKERYLALLPLVCGPGDDGHYGSSSEHDVYALQAIARRIHFGAFYVAESKYRSAPGLYRGLVEKGDRAAIVEALTRPEVEKAVIERVLVKVEMLQITVGSAKGGDAIRRLLRPEPVRDFYRDVVIPLTKEGEVRYLLNRKLD